MRDGFTRLDGLGPHLDEVGPLFERDGVLALEVQERHLNAAGTCHGGLLATLVDSALGAAVRDELDEGRPATVSLTTDYLGAVERGDWVEARAEVERLGGSLAFADCSLRVGDKEVVRARAVFAVL
jgi:uncharacterized protein (TIGR00369 family)